MVWQQIKRSVQEESIFNAVCEYKIICDAPYPDAQPYPFVSDTNWGPGECARLSLSLSMWTALCNCAILQVQ